MLHPPEGNTSRAQPLFASGDDDDRVPLLRAAPVRGAATVLSPHRARSTIRRGTWHGHFGCGHPPTPTYLPIRCASLCLTPPRGDLHLMVRGRRGRCD